MVDVASNQGHHHLIQQGNQNHVQICLLFEWPFDVLIDKGLIQKFEHGYEWLEGQSKGIFSRGSTMIIAHLSKEAFCINLLRR